jgi:hypothetical protein
MSMGPLISPQVRPTILNAAKRSEGGRKPRFIVAHVHEAHPE